MGGGYEEKKREVRLEECRSNGRKNSTKEGLEGGRSKGWFNGGRLASGRGDVKCRLQRILPKN